MIRVLKKREGFTLIELMMVVAVIGILAAVLVPRIGTTKDSAKLSGMDTNVRSVQAIIESEIGRYQSTVATNPGLFATRVSSRCTGVVNPFTNVQNGAVATAIPTDPPTTAVVIVNDPSIAASTTTDLDLRGSVVVTITAVSNAINTATITPFDELGQAMTATVVNR